MYLIDTDWVVDWLVGKTAAVQLLQSMALGGIAISLDTFGEIYEGTYYGRDPKAAEAGFRHFLRGVTVLPLNRTIMRNYARIRGGLRQQGSLIGDVDLLIAATALTHGLVLVMRNRRHFQRVPGLLIHP